MHKIFLQNKNITTSCRPDRESSVPLDVTKRQKRIRSFLRQRSAFSKKSNSGFTFVELIMVIAIFGILSSVVLFNYGNFTSTITLQNLTHDIALQVNQAQKTAISGLGNRITGFTGGYKPTYGVYFEKGGMSLNLRSGQSGAKEFIYFTDSLQGEANGVYDHGNYCPAPSATECLDEINIQTGDSIDRLCVNVVAQLGAFPVKCDLDDLSVTFTRPFPDAIIKINSDPTTSEADAEIVVKSIKGDKKTIVVTKLGQVYIEDKDITP